MQLILLIHFVYEISEWLVHKDNGWAWALLISGSVVGFGLGLVLIGLSYYYFAPSANCSLNMFFITWSIVLLLMLIGVLFVPKKAPSAGLLTSGAVFLYCSFLLYSALNSEPPDYRCIKDSGGSSAWVQVGVMGQHHTPMLHLVMHPLVMVHRIISEGTSCIPPSWSASECRLIDILL